MDLYRRGHAFSDHELHTVYKGQKMFFHNVGLMGIKRRRILRRFQKFKLKHSDKMRLKKLFLDKDCHLYTVGFKRVHIS
jgi:hypothetical protein